MNEPTAIRTLLAQIGRLSKEEIQQAEHRWRSDSQFASDTWTNHLVHLGVLAPSAARSMDMVCKGYVSADTLQLGKEGVAPLRIHDATPSAGDASPTTTSATTDASDIDISNSEPWRAGTRWVHHEILEDETQDALSPTCLAVDTDGHRLVRLRKFGEAVDPSRLEVDLRAHTRCEGILGPIGVLEHRILTVSSEASLGLSIGDCLRQGQQFGLTAIARTVAACTRILSRWQAAGRSHGALHPDLLRITPSGDLRITDATLVDALRKQDATLPPRLLAFQPGSASRQKTVTQLDHYSLARIALMMHDGEPSAEAAEERAGSISDPHLRQTIESWLVGSNATTAPPHRSAPPPRRRSESTEDLLSSMRTELLGTFRSSETPDDTTKP